MVGEERLTHRILGNTPWVASYIQMSRWIWQGIISKPFFIHLQVNERNEVVTGRIILEGAPQIQRTRKVTFWVLSNSQYQLFCESCHYYVLFFNFWNTQKWEKKKKQRLFISKNTDESSTTIYFNRVSQSMAWTFDPQGKTIFIFFHHCAFLFCFYSKGGSLYKQKKKNSIKNR